MFAIIKSLFISTNQPTKLVHVYLFLNNFIFNLQSFSKKKKVEAISCVSLKCGFIFIHMFSNITELSNSTI